MPFPCYVQPKLDGVRGVAVGNEIFSRNGNPFPTLEHIKRELGENTEGYVLDGELYTDDINFEKIVGLVKKEKKTEEEQKETLKIYLNVFDYIDYNGLTNKERNENLDKFFSNHNFKYIKRVKTEICEKEEDVDFFLNKYISEGYEGVILRNINGSYETDTRSKNLQKLKKFIDKEYTIVDYTCPPSGKEEGCVIWICKTEKGKKFRVKPLGSFEERKKNFKDGKKFIGKILTVKFQELTSDGVPRFPFGIAVRDYE